MNEKDIIDNLENILKSNKVTYFTWQRICSYIEELYLKEIKQSTLKDTLK